MDSLLRDYARHRAARLSAERDDTPAEQRTIEHDNIEHPDADELTAFAENALPAAARTRYVAHLADCDACRQLAIALMPAENTASESAKHIPPQSVVAAARPLWREKLAAFFALQGLRYAIPALAATLFLALIVGILVNRRQHTETLVASQEQTKTTAARTDSASSESEIATNSDTTANSADQMSGSSSMSNMANTTTAKTTTTTTTTTNNTAAPARGTINANSSTTPKESHANSASRNDGNISGNTPSVANITQPPAARDKQNFDDDAIRTPARNRANTDAAAPPSAATGNANMSANSAGVAAVQREREEVSVTSTNVAKASRSNASNSSSSNNAAQTSDSTSFSTEARAADRRRATSPATTAAKNDLPLNGRAANNAAIGGASSPPRRINGRDFRRQGTRWIDAAYTSSQSTTNLARGSKQLRRLINEEPGIGKITAQLDGEIIVVWKGRAYRIR